MSQSLEDRARDPNTSPTALLYLAKVVPEEVLENPVLPLLAVEDPDLYGRVVGQARDRMASVALRRLLDTFRKEEGRLFAIACGERALAFLVRRGEDSAELENILHEAKEYLVGMRRSPPEVSRGVGEVLRLQREKKFIAEYAAGSLYAMCRVLAVKELREADRDGFSNDLSYAAQSLASAAGHAAGPDNSAPFLLARAGEVEHALHLAGQIAGKSLPGRQG